MANEKLDLIDRKDLLAEYDRVHIGEPGKARKLIEDATGVDAVELVHAEWIDEYPYVRCSECNAEWINCRTDNEPKFFYYCPNCGADMRGTKDGKE